MLIYLNENTRIIYVTMTKKRWTLLKFYPQPGNHDQLRLVSRFGEEKARMITAMSLLLPGVAVNYYGDEIGMSDTYISWEDTQDPQGCGAGKENYQTMSRDPARTPFQWDDSVSAGKFLILHRMRYFYSIVKATIWTNLNLCEKMNKLLLQAKVFNVWFL